MSSVNQMDVLFACNSYLGSLFKFPFFILFCFLCHCMSLVSFRCPFVSCGLGVYIHFVLLRFVLLCVYWCFHLFYLPFDGIQCYRTRYIQFIFDEHFTHVAIKVCQLNGTFVCVRKVDVIVDPIDGQTI